MLTPAETPEMAKEALRNIHRIISQSSAFGPGTGAISFEAAHIPARVIRPL